MTRTVVNADRVAPGLFSDFDRLDGTEVVGIMGSGGTYGTQNDDSAGDVDDEDLHGAGVLRAGVTGGVLALLVERHFGTYHAARRAAEHAVGDDVDHEVGSAVGYEDVRDGDHVVGPQPLSAGRGKVAALAAQLRVVDVVQNYRRQDSCWPRFGQQTPVSGSFRRHVRLLNKVMSTDICIDLGPATISIVFSGGDIESERLLDAELMELLAQSAQSGTMVTYPRTPIEYAVTGVAGHEDPAAWFEGRQSDNDFSAGVDSDELGTPSTTILTGAVDDLRAWLSMTQRDVAQFVGISAQTMMSWKREEPRFPRHRRIPVLLSLWAAASGAREALDASAVARLVWGGVAAGRRRSSTDGGGGRAGVPVVSAEELTDLLLDAATRHVLAASTDDDGYVPGTSLMPSREELARAAREAGEGRGDADHEADAPRG